MFQVELSETDLVIVTLTLITNKIFCYFVFLLCFWFVFSIYFQIMVWSLGAHTNHLLHKNIGSN